MILSRNQILEEISKKRILIEPFREDCVGPNSYDIHLGRFIATYTDRVLDSKHHNPIEEMVIPNDGLILQPGTMYLAVSEEYTEVNYHVPHLEGISSVARLGINVNAASGKASVGHCNTWTMELNVIQPVKVYHGMPIAQLIFYVIQGDVEEGYSIRKNAKYGNRSIKPIESMMWKNKF